MIKFQLKNMNYRIFRAGLFFLLFTLNCNTNVDSGKKKQAPAESPEKKFKRFKKIESDFAPIGMNINTSTRYIQEFDTLGRLIVIEGFNKNINGDNNEFKNSEALLSYNEKGDLISLKILSIDQNGEVSKKEHHFLKHDNLYQDESLDIEVVGSGNINSYVLYNSETKNEWTYRFKGFYDLQGNITGYIIGTGDVDILIRKYKCIIKKKNESGDWTEILIQQVSREIFEPNDFKRINKEFLSPISLDALPTGSESLQTRMIEYQ